jgi:hypothetical protein
MKRIAALAVSSIVLIAACASTSIIATWKDPAANQVHFNRVLVVVPSRDPALRRSAEDELARRIRAAEAAQAVPSYTVLSDQEVADREHLKEKVRQLGFDGLVVFRVAAVDKEATWVPGTYWGPYYGFGGWPVWDPGYIRTDTVVQVETDVYSTTDDRLIWAARSKTYDPRSMKQLVDEVTKAVSKQMKKQGLIG